MRRRRFLKTGIGASVGTFAASLEPAGIVLADDFSFPDSDESARPTMLDTEALVWVDQDDERLGPNSRRLVDEALIRGSLYVSSVTFWEVFSLVRLKRIDMRIGVSDWRRSLLDAGIRELGVDGVIGIPEDDRLDGDYFHSAKLSIKLRPLLSTPRDRLISTPPHLLGSLIVASAVRLGATFVTSDGHLLQWSSDQVALNRHDARN